MRSALVTTATALTVLLSVSAGYAQSSQSSAAPPASSKEYEAYWPTAAQEAAIPYRPCEIAVGWQDRRLICWSTEPLGRTRIARWHRRIRRH